MIDIASNLHAILQDIPEGTKLVAVSKFHSVAAIQEAYRAGQRIFGESREQELRQKVHALPEDIEWHYIGHLQTNKVKYIVPYIYMVESVDSMKLLEELEKQAAKIDKTVKVLLEIKVSAEETKSGLTLETCRTLLADGGWRSLRHVEICGLMTIASNTDDERQVASEFDVADRFFAEVKKAYFADVASFCEKSWGMSYDYRTALLHGSNMIRVGTSIFGERIY
ncbi:YggS family pyridoxal phosphate-dependent enzyme [Prevotella sp. A2931]|uniref:Pyridoxal phosphate homeostasis protein n=1 Tax=Prevotella illustrans TaxID=2800387 RepID=A0ABS3M2M3_9BACT|nr:MULTISPECIES: YggS family pyridoxal phosphate-dependent enzyme [Prevotella]MBO1362437.1 YggS family pyridoxal phosphate-dependent enzyme [Prevotella illustrans]PTL25048.1 YggS family pyridoxal phosphate-dependent enzyme [Prevotella sp. oral taxon 820]